MKRDHFVEADTIQPLLEVSSLSVSLHSSTREFRDIVKNVSFTLKNNQTMALVGESGSGKTVIARALMQLFSSPALFISEGSVKWKGEELTHSTEKRMRALRGFEISYIPQAPMSSMNPMMTIQSQLIEGYRRGTKEEAIHRAKELLKKSGFSYPERILASYPQELSGGMKQRVVIIMALMNYPDLIIADEPTTALDVSLQAEIIALMIELVRDNRSSLLFITHDLGIVARIADEVMIMRNGKIIESQNVFSLFHSPQNEYTRLLIESTTIDPHSL